MTHACRGLAWLLGGGALALAATVLHAQGPAGPPGVPAGLPTEITQVRFNAGQAVVPYFEGWIKNPDGTFEMVFGYFNRNWQQELAIPVGANNKIEPMTGDQNQPTYFLPRRQRFIYRVRVPANFGKQAVIWSVTANGKSERAYGELIPEQEINERVVSTNGNFNPGHDDPNQPPTLTLKTTLTATVGTAVALPVQCADDGLPKPRVAPGPKPVATSGTATTSPFTAQVNSSAPRRPLGLRVSWLQVRGPAKAIFSPAAPVFVTGTQGTVDTSVRFSEAGVYTLIATVGDGAMSRSQEVSVTVTR